MFFASPTSNITPALVSVAMTRSDSRDSTTSNTSFSAAQVQVSYSTSPSTYRSNSSSNISSTRMSRDSFSSGWMPSPYRSCMLHSSSSQGYDSSSSYITDDDLLALEDLAMPPTEHIPTVTSAQRQEQRSNQEMTTEQHIAMLQEMQDREQAQIQQQRQRAQQQQKALRFAAEQRKPRRPSGLGSQRRSTASRRS